MEVPASLVQRHEAANPLTAATPASSPSRSRGTHVTLEVGTPNFLTPLVSGMSGSAREPRVTTYREGVAFRQSGRRETLPFLHGAVGAEHLGMA